MIRPPAVAGMFYPDGEGPLRRAVSALLAEASSLPRRAGPPAKAYLLPHAGYVYSGSNAALGYADLARRAGAVTRVVLLGPTHRVAVEGLALPEADALATPLGAVPVAPVPEEVRAHLPQLVDSAEVHALEHSLEVHLPFLQVALGEFEVLPLAVGRAAPWSVAEVLDALWGGAETVVVVSSDLSHYLGYDEARTRDAATVRRILALAPDLRHDEACGATPANGLLTVAGQRRMHADLLGACNSGDTAGDRRRVVGYAAVSFTEPAAA